ncbi:hypothetical protein Tco_1073470, partial [Tanacetum coccineum]
MIMYLLNHVFHYCLTNQEENEKDVEDDEEEKNDELVKTLSNSADDEDETNVDDKIEGDEDEGMFIQKEGTDAEMTNVQQWNENLKITLNQVIEDAHVTLSTIPQKTEVLVTSSSHSSDLASKFLNFLDIPHTDAEIVSPMDVMSIMRECYDGLIKSYNLDKSLFSTYDKIYSFKRSRKDKDKDEDPSAGSDRWLKKRKTSTDTEPTTGLKTKDSKSGSSKGAKSQSKSFRKSVQSEEPDFKVADSVGIKRLLRVNTAK